jgi:hypothetical protein
VPAAAVIPAPQVYSYTAAVKKLVVGSECLACGVAFSCYCNAAQSCWWIGNALYWVLLVASEFTLNKSECSIQAFCLNISAWNNRIGLCVLFCWFSEPE